MKATKQPKAKATKQTKLKLKLKPRQILMDDELFSLPAVAPPLAKQNAATRFVLCPASEWADVAQENSGGFVGKVVKVVNSSVQVQFSDGKAWLSWEFVSRCKPLN